MPKAKKSNSKKGGLGVVAIAAAAAAAGAYFLYGKEAEKRRGDAKKKVTGWMLRAKGEVLEQMEKAKSLSKKEYDDIVDKVAIKYEALKGVDNKELSIMVKELKGHWSSIRDQVKKEEKNLKAKKNKKVSTKKK